eukprot:m.76823 g.76823  ORF g.76823 m.76823 type:complete len:69 (-) comp24937_c0_seq1:86-292(-)
MVELYMWLFVVFMLKNLRPKQAEEHPGQYYQHERACLTPRIQIGNKKHLVNSSSSEHCVTQPSQAMAR